MSRPVRLRPVEFARLALLAAAVLPPRLVSEGPVLCPFRRATGLPCPTCGLTRSWTSLAHLRVRDAFAYHPLGPVTFVGAGWLALGGRLHAPKADEDFERKLASVAVAAWLAVWVGRLVRSARRQDVAPD